MVLCLSFPLRTRACARQTPCTQTKCEPGTLLGWTNCVAFSNVCRLNCDFLTLSTRSSPVLHSAAHAQNMSLEYRAGLFATVRVSWLRQNLEGHVPTTSEEQIAAASDRTLATSCAKLKARDCVLEQLRLFRPRWRGRHAEGGATGGTPCFSRGGTKWGTGKWGTGRGGTKCKCHHCTEQNVFSNDGVRVKAALAVHHRQGCCSYAIYIHDLSTLAALPQLCPGRVNSGALSLRVALSLAIARVLRL